MKKGIIILGLLGLTIFGGLYAKRKFYDPKYRVDNVKTEVKQLADNNEIKNGDLIFQTSLSGQSKAIQLATDSKYSHCGLIYKDGNDISRTVRAGSAFIVWHKAVTQSTASNASSGWGSAFRSATTGR